MSAAILIVDDDKGNQELLMQDLGEEGYRIHSAAAGQQALEVLEEKEFDLVILELKLSDMNGVEVMRQVSLSHPETRLVILTAKRSFESAVAAVRSGAVDYLLKPCEKEELLGSVARALADKTERDQKKRLHRQIESSLKKLREADGVETPEIPPRRVITVGEGVMVDLDRREMWRDEKKVVLTPSESLLLIIFLENRGRVLSHQELVREVKQEEVDEDLAPEILRPMISRLRKKLNTFSQKREWVRNVRGKGYLFEVGK